MTAAALVLLTTLLSPAVAPAAAGVQGARRQATNAVDEIQWRGQAGLVFDTNDTGFILGGAGSGRPIAANRDVEIMGDANFERLAGFNGFYGSANGLYHFAVSNPDISPFAGAGVGIAHLDDSTTARPQLMGGLDFNRRAAHPMRADIRFFLTEGNVTTIVTFGYSFGR
jgi:opacity protein-like surface antigen